MKRKKELQQTLDALIAEESEQLERLKDVGLAGEEETEYNTRRERIEELQAQIEELEKAEAKIRAAEERASKERRNAGRREPAQVEENLAKKPFASIGEFLKDVFLAKSTGQVSRTLLLNQYVESERLAGRNIETLAPLGSNTATPGEGGWLVSEDYRTQLVSKTFEASTLASRCTEAMLGDGVTKTSIPYVVENSRATGTRHGGLRAYRTNEAASVMASGPPSIKRIELAAEKMMCLTYLSEEQIVDAAGLTSYINRVVPAEFAFTVDDEIINGTGAGRCLGILNSPCLITVNKASGQAADTFVRQNVEDMWVRMWGRSRGSAIWLYNQEMEPQFNQFTLEIGTGGVPVYVPPGTYGVNGQPSLKGRPMIPIEQCSALGDVGDIILCDPSQYLLVRKGQMRSDSSMHVQFLTDQMAFRWIMYVNGQPLWESALTPYKGSATLSPFVALQAR